MDNLKKLRTSHHLSQQKLGEKFNLSQQSIYKYENNLAEPDISTLKDFARFFNTSVDYLIGFSMNSDGSSSMEPDEVEIHLLWLYRKLNSRMQMYITGIMEEFANEQERLQAANDGRHASRDVLTSNDGRHASRDTSTSNDGRRSSRDTPTSD